MVTLSINEMQVSIWQNNPPSSRFKGAWALFMCQASRQRLWWYRRLVVIILELSHAIVWFVFIPRNRVIPRNHTIAWDNSKIITTNRRYHQRRCLEARHINSAPLLWIVTTVDYCQMLTCISLIDDVTTQSRAWKVTRYSAKIAPDEDTRPECRNVGSRILTSLGYVHNIFTNQSSIVCLVHLT